MSDRNQENRVIQFGAFELDLAAGELLKGGSKVRLQEQPYQVLVALLERPGEVVTREELQERVWNGETFVDFDGSLSTAVNKIRHALGDSASHPRFVETVPRRGYRFLAEVSQAVPRAKKPARGATRLAFFWATGCLAVVAAAAFLMGRVGTEPSSQPAAWSFRAPPVNDVAAPLVAVPFTTYDGVEFNPTFSPDASQVAFAMASDFAAARRQLYIKSVGAEQPRKITDHRGKVYGPAWSPTGRRIAYMLQTSDGRYELRIVPPNGGSDRLVTELGPPSGSFLYANGWGFPLSWSPDGRFVAAPSTTGDGQPMAIYLVDVDRREKRQLTFPESGIAGDVDPKFSHSGDRLAFGRQSYGIFSSQLHILALDEAMMPVGDPKHLPIRGEKPEPFQYVFCPNWTHDDSEIIVKVRGGLRRLASNGTGSATLLGLDPGALAASLSNDGRKLIFNKARLDSDVWQYDRRNGKVGSLINSSSVDHTPRISPDGARIAFVSGRSGFGEIWVCRADGTDAVRLTFLNRRGIPGLGWSPDGATLAFNSLTDGSIEIFTISVDGGPPRQLTTHPDNGANPTWSPDGKHVYFGSARDGQQRIWSVSADGGEARRVSDSEGWLPKVSADGEYLYFQSRRPGEGAQLLRKRLPDGPEEIALDKVFTFTLGQTGLYFIREEASTTLHRRDFESGEVEDVFESTKRLVAIEVSPDEQTVLFGQTEEQVDLMLVENFR